MRGMVHVAHMKEMRNAYKILSGKPGRKTSLGRCRHRWEEDIKMDLGETQLECVVDSSGSGQGPMVGSCDHSNKTSGSIKGR
jgi:hypothetical protein